MDPTCRFCGAKLRWLPVERRWKTATGSNYCSDGPFGAHNVLTSWELMWMLQELAAETVIPEIPPLCDFVPSNLDLDYWRHTYAIKPEWWDDPEEPRCDYCGIHCEDTNIDARGGWCGYCGRCGDHCECLSVLD